MHLSKTRQGVCSTFLHTSGSLQTAQYTVLPSCALYSLSLVTQHCCSVGPRAPVGQGTPRCGRRNLCPAAKNKENKDSRTESASLLNYIVYGSYCVETLKNYRAKEMSSLQDNSTIHIIKSKNPVKCKLTKVSKSLKLKLKKKERSQLFGFQLGLPFQFRSDPFPILTQAANTVKITVSLLPLVGNILWIQ